MKRHGPKEDPVAAARRRLKRVSLWLLLFAFLFVSSITYAICDASDAFYIVHIRGGILGSGFAVPFVMTLVFTGLATILLIAAVRRAWHEYELARRADTNHAQTSNQ